MKKFLCLIAILSLAGAACRPAAPDVTYLLLFDATGRTHEDFNVPAGRALYLVRAQAVSQGTATVQNLLTLTNYVMNDGVTICRINIAVPADVSLAFLARSNNNILSLNAEVINPRGGIPNCA